ncbi:MAG TPA: (deoxy)nucleoside triphosphate pyrophosphohydrolase, partial [Pseudonocardiaceae bacterium]|nr:(deoxy)nucleoside triphosphate pyrophosphohydrolase [Pseudonocardiaceae bacterium]
MVHSLAVAAPARTVAAALAEPRLLRDVLGARVPRREQLVRGDVIVVRGLRWRVARADQRGLELAGPWPVRLNVSTVDGVTMVGSDFRWAPRTMTALLAAVRDRAEQLTAAPVVVGAAIVRDGTVLAGQRTEPPAVAGRWEFPGGKVEPGESERAAVVRECREELAADVVVGGRLGPDLVLANGWLLRLYLATLAPGARPVAGEHRAVRWVPADRLAELDWLAADRVVLPELA